MIFKNIVTSIIILAVAAVILFEIVLAPVITEWNFVKAVILIIGIITIGMLFLSRPSSLRIQDLVGKKRKSAFASFKVITKEDKLKKEPGFFRIPDSVRQKPFDQQPVVKKLFGTAGIRGLTNTEITPMMALKISQVYADWLGNKGTIAVGHDTRYGAEILTQSIVSGLRSGGLNVVDCGCIPTGGLASHIVENKLSGGVLVTGSHMPYNMIGIIIVQSDGAYIPEEIAHNLEARFANYDSRQSKVLPEMMGEYKLADNPLPRYKKFLLKMVDNNLIKSKKFKVLVDPANGTASIVLPELLRELGCEVYLINEVIKPVPDRVAEPRAGNLTKTAEKLKEYKCDIGIATDVDADRVLFIDEKGEVISEDLIGSIFAKSVMDKHTPSDRLCVTPINSSGLIEHTCEKEAIKLEYCPVGQPATLKVVKNLRANFSYEESGKYYFADEAIWADGLISGIKLLEIMAKTNKTLSQLASEFPKFYQVKHTMHCELVRMDKIIKKVFEIWQKEALEGKVKDITVDGLKRVYNDKSWLLIRASGTEPLIRVYADATTTSRAEELVKWGEEIVKKAM